MLEVKRRPETRRKIPNYFGDYAGLALVWADGWRVRFWCDQLHRWEWENLETVRIGKKLESEAKAAAVKLMRAGSERWLKAAESMQKTGQRLAIEADGIESGRIDWSAL